MKDTDAAKDAAGLHKAVREDREARNKELQRTRGYEERLEVLRKYRQKQRERLDEAAYVLGEAIDRG